MMGRIPFDPFRLVTIALPVLLSFLMGCDSDRRSREVTLFFSGDTSGWITPCGCTSNQSGGLSRRDSLVDSARRAGPVLALDVGGNVAGDSPYDLAKLRSIFRGLKEMDYAAINLGGAETQFLASEIRQLGDDFDLPLLSTNVTDRDGKPLAPRHRVIEAGGMSFAVLGVVDPTMVGKDMLALDPLESIVDQLASITADRVIVLAYIDAPGLRQLAQRLPEVDAVIGGPTGQVQPPKFVGNVLVGSSTNKGKFLIETLWPTDKAAPSRVTAKVVEVTSELSLADRQQDNLKRFYQRLDEADFSPDQTTFVSSRLMRDDAPRVVGSETCQSCHQLDDQVWHDSKHIHAWDSLQTTGAQVDPACQRCHTTGYGMAGGFVSHHRSLKLVNVGCENCHGPSSKHVADVTVRTPYDARQQCVSCHDHENSPTFDYEVFWSRVRHGKQPADAPQPLLSVEQP